VGYRVLVALPQPEETVAGPRAVGNLIGVGDNLTGVIPAIPFLPPNVGNGVNLAIMLFGSC
jgi:hypothetical protein